MSGHLSKSLLIYEHDRAAKYSLQYHLGEQGYGVDIVSTYGCFLRRLKESKSYLIAVDLEAPNLDFSALLADLKFYTDLDAAGFIFIYDPENSSRLNALLELPCVYFLRKPINYHEVIALVRQASRQVDVSRSYQVHQEIVSANELRVEMALRDSGVGLWDWNIETGEFLINNLWHEILGYSEDELPDNLDLWSNFCHPDDIEQAKEKLIDHLKGYTKYYEAEYRMKAKSGRWKWILDRGKVLKRDLSGEALHIVGTHLLINNRVRAEEELKSANQGLEKMVEERTAHLERIITRLRRTESVVARNERKFRSVFEQSSVGIVMLDCKHRVTDVNRSLCLYSGFRREDLLGRKALEFLEVNDPSLSIDDVNSLLENEADFKFECKYKRYRKSELHCSTIVNHVKGGDESQNYIIAVIEDLTEQKKNEELRDDIERITRHDLKTPLSGMIAVPELLRQSGDLSSVQENLVELLENSAVTMLNIINLSHDIYKMEKQTYSLRPTVVDIVGIVRKIEVELSRMFKYKHVNMEIAIKRNPGNEHDSFLIWGEELLCYSMVSNLLKNAIEAAPKESRITITLDAGESHFITIHNQGAVPEAIRESFFDKYTSSGKARGTGLGTYSARLIAETHKGSIGMTTSDDDGTTITVAIPRPEELL